MKPTITLLNNAPRQFEVEESGRNIARRERRSQKQRLSGLWPSFEQSKQLGFEPRRHPRLIH